MFRGGSSASRFEAKVEFRQKFNPYFRLMRLHQPVGIWLLFWPCAWGVMLASPDLPPLLPLVLFALGAITMRSSGCIINDIWDINIDKQVERTRTRPLASGELSVRQALATLAVLLSIALLIAAALGTTIIIWSLAAMPLVILYPLMKRITWWPQAFLGLTFNWGALLGWIAVRGSVEWPALLLYAGSVFWTLGYDTIYAHQDKADDARIGVKSTALRLGARTKPYLALFYGLAILGWVLAGIHPLGIALMIIHFTGQITRLDINSPHSCQRIFLSNAHAGALLFLGGLIGKIWVKTV